MDKELIGYISLIITVIAYAPYIWSVLRGTTKPHIFSWFLWSILMAIAAAGQSAAFAGPGAWAMALSALACFIITALAFRNGEKDITKKDIAVLIIALMAIPIWIMTKNPLGAILLLTAIDALSYLPTLRKANKKPYEEMALHYTISNAKHILSIMAISVYSVTTVIYPAVLFLMNSVLIILIYVRRAQIKK